MCYPAYNQNKLKQVAEENSLEGEKKKAELNLPSGRGRPSCELGNLTKLNLLSRRGRHLISLLFK